MAASLLGVIAQVPWNKVIENAPDIISGASKLFANLPRTRDEFVRQESGVVREATPPALLARLDAAEDAILTLNKQLTEATTLIGALAASNQSLLGRVQVQQRIVIALGAIALCLAVAVCFALVR